MQKNLVVAAFSALGLRACAGTTDLPRSDPLIDEQFGASRRARIVDDFVSTFFHV